MLMAEGRQCVIAAMHWTA